MEVIGRDTMIRFNVGEKQVRALVESETVVDKKEVLLTVRDEKIHLFDYESEIALRKLQDLTPEEIEKAREEKRIEKQKFEEAQAIRVEKPKKSKRERR